MSDLTFVEPTVSRRFLNELSAEEDTPFMGKRYVIAGSDWHGHESDIHDWLTKHCDDQVILDVCRAYSGNGFSWKFSKRIADGVYVWHSGHAASIEAACIDALAYRPVVRRCKYLNSTTVWYETEPGRLTAEIGGEEATITKSFDEQWRYERKWAAAKPIFDQVGSAFATALSGLAPSEKAAMILCLDATDNFKRACAAFVATLTDESA